MSLDGSQTIDYGTLGISITGLAFHPDGTLYGVAPQTGQLVTIDPATVSFNVVGSLQTAGGIFHSKVPDIAVMGTQLVGWTRNNDDFVLIDHTTAVVTPIASPQFVWGPGIAYNSATGQILLAANGSTGPLYTVNPATGAVTAGPILQGVQSNVKGMSYKDGLLYGFDSGFGFAGNFVTYNPTTGAMNVLGTAPSSSIDAVAIYDPGNVAP
jgi:hypothetical protein